MNNILLSPAIAFILYLSLAGLLSLFGRWFAGPTQHSEAKSSLYSSGEAGPGAAAIPGYRPFFVIALFFAVLHLGSLVVGNSGLFPMAGLYLGGLILALIALILG